MILPWNKASATLTAIPLPPWRAAGGLMARTGWRPINVEGSWLHYQKDQFAWGPLEVLLGGGGALAAMPPQDWLGDTATSGPVHPGGLVLWPGGSLRLNGPLGRCWVRPHRARSFEQDRTPTVDMALPPVGSAFGEYHDGAPVDGSPTLWTGSDEAWLGEAAWESQSLLLPGLQASGDITDPNSTPYQQGQCGFTALLADSSNTWDRMYMAPLTWEEWIPRAMLETFGRAVWTGRQWWASGSVKLTAAAQTVPVLFGLQGGLGHWGATSTDTMQGLSVELPTLPNPFRSWSYGGTDGVRVTVPGAGTDIVYAYQASVALTRGPSAHAPRIRGAWAWSSPALLSPGLVTVALPNAPHLTLGFSVKNDTALGTATVKLLGQAGDFNAAGPGKPGRFLTGGTFAAVTATLVSGEVISGQQQGGHTLQVETDTGITGLGLMMTMGENT